DRNVCPTGSIRESLLPDQAHQLSVRFPVGEIRLHGIHFGQSLESPVELATVEKKQPIVSSVPRSPDTIPKENSLIVRQLYEPACTARCARPRSPTGRSGRSGGRRVAASVHHGPGRDGLRDTGATSRPARLRTVPPVAQRPPHGGGRVPGHVSRPRTQ